MNIPIRNDEQNQFLASLNVVPVCKRQVADTDWFPAVDVSDQGDEYRFEFDLPGVAREEIQISLDGNTLHLTGIRTTQQQGGKNLRAERPSGAFMRQLLLPPDACGNEIQATMVDGVLELRVPRKTPTHSNGESKVIQLDKHYEHKNG